MAARDSPDEPNETEDNMKTKYADKIITVEWFGFDDYAWHNDVCFDPAIRFVGKLIRFAPR